MYAEYQHSVGILTGRAQKLSLSFDSFQTTASHAELPIFREQYSHIKINFFQNLRGVTKLRRLFIALQNEELYLIAIVTKINDSIPETFKGMKVICREYSTTSYESLKAMYSEDPSSAIDKKDLSKVQNKIQNECASLMRKHSNLEIMSASGNRSMVQGRVLIKQTCVVLYCTLKGFIPVGEEEFPKHINGIPIDVREGMFHLNPGDGDNWFPSSKSFHREIKMGCNIGARGKVPVITIFNLIHCPLYDKAAVTFR